MLTVPAVSDRMPSAPARERLVDLAYVRDTTILLSRTDPPPDCRCRVGGASEAGERRRSGGLLDGRRLAREEAGQLGLLHAEAAWRPPLHLSALPQACTASACRPSSAAASYSAGEGVWQMEPEF